MLECPICTGEARVVDSRAGFKKDSINFIRRRRECSACDYRYTTYELPEQDFHNYHSMLKGIESIQKHLATVTKSFDGIQSLMETEKKYKDDPI